MLSFDPPQLRDQLTSAMRRMEKLLQDEYEFASEAFNPAAEDFDPSEYEDDVVVKADDRFDLSLPRCDDSLSLSYEEFVRLVDELEQSHLEGNLECWTPRRYYLRVEPMFWGYDGPYIPDGLVKELRSGDAALKCSVTSGYTPFGFLVAAKGDWDKYFPPVLAEDYFVEVIADRPLKRDDLRAIVEAFRFEVSATIGLDLRPSPRPELGEWNEEEAVKLPPLRDLLAGPGIQTVLEVYNKAACVNDPEIELLYFTKVFEYVAQTVVRQRLTDTIRAKLQSPAALNPTANFVLELQALFAEEGTYRKDREAIALAVSTCCEPTELAKECPPFLKELKTVSATTKRKDKDAALVIFAKSLYSTRNSIAHAKANYEPTGDECPQGELAQFSRCAKVAAQQAVRWYAARPETERVT